MASATTGNFEKLRLVLVPHRSDYDPYAADREGDYDPFAEFTERKPRHYDPDVIAFFERSRLYGTPVQPPNGGTAYWMD